MKPWKLQKKKMKKMRRGFNGRGGKIGEKGIMYWHVLTRTKLPKKKKGRRRKNRKRREREPHVWGLGTQTTGAVWFVYTRKL